MTTNAAATRIKDYGFYGYLILTIMVCGALVMTVEVMGARMIGPFFGVSLFVWTSLITVTLICLAGGYWIGGIACDRWPQGGVRVIYCAFAVPGSAG